MKEEALLNAWHCNVPIIRRLRNLGLCHISAGNSDISARLLTRQAGPRRDLKAWNASWGAYGAPDLETALVMPGDFCKLCATSACTGRLRDWTDPLTAHGDTMRLHTLSIRQLTGMAAIACAAALIPAAALAATPPPLTRVGTWSSSGPPNCDKHPASRPLPNQGSRLACLRPAGSRPALPHAKASARADPVPGA